MASHATTTDTAPRFHRAASRVRYLPGQVLNRRTPIYRFLKSRVIVKMPSHTVKWPSMENPKTSAAASLSTQACDDKMWGIFVAASDPDIEAGTHAHSTGILTGVKTGTVSIQSEQGSWILVAGATAYIPPNVPHAISMANGYTGWALSIPKAQQHFLPEHISILKISRLLSEAIQRIAAPVDPPDEISKARENIMAVVIDELKNVKKAGFLQIPLPKNPNLQSIAETIIKAPEDMRSIDDWAGKAAMSTRSFTRHFFQETGLTFVAWRRRVKVHAALQMLSNGDQVTEVAFNLGYQNVSAFVAMFRRQFGAPPGEYVQSTPADFL